MKRPLIAIIICCFICIAFSIKGLCQSTAADSAQYQAIINNTKNNFYSAIGLQSRLYNGYENMSYNRNIKGSAYQVDSLYFVNGNVDYDGIVYQNIPLVLDVYKDLLISVLNDHLSKFSLLSEKVRSFDLADHHYVRILSDTSNLKTGYYDEVYHGKLRALVRREKTMQVTGSGQVIENYFNDATSYYLKKDQLYYPVNSKGAFFKVLKDKKKELKQFLKTSKIKYRKEPEKAMVLLAAYYDRLTN